MINPNDNSQAAEPCAQLHNGQVPADAKPVYDATTERADSDMSERYGVTREKFQKALAAVFILMHDHKIPRIVIEQNGKFFNTKVG